MHSNGFLYFIGIGSYSGPDGLRFGDTVVLRFKLNHWWKGHLPAFSAPKSLPQLYWPWFWKNIWKVGVNTECTVSSPVGTRTLEEVYRPCLTRILSSNKEIMERREFSNYTISKEAKSFSFLNQLWRMDRQHKI